MKTITNPARKSKIPPAFKLFDTVPEDLLQFGHGQQFNAKKAASFLSLKNADVGRISSVAPKSVRYDQNMPEAVKTKLEEIAGTVNLVAKQFDGDPHKTVTWFKASNPLLGDVSPRDMIRLGRYDQLRRFIIHAMVEQTQAK